jgi:hypothetical protein
MPPRHHLVALALALASPAQTALASGSYPPNPPRLGGSALSKIDARTYNLGKTLFTDRLALPDESPADCDPAANLARLSAVQARLPERVRAEVDLATLAPRLNTAQVDALLYYVGIRFRLETPPASLASSAPAR